MARLIGTIVDDKFRLIGLKVSAKKNELYGGSDTTRVEAHWAIDQLLERGIKTKQIDFSSGRPVIVGNFSLKDLPMEVYVNGTFTPIVNEVEATQRITKDGEDVGYVIKLGDIEVPLTLAQINEVAKIMKPKNFVVRHTDDGKAFVAAKHGTIAELPVLRDLSSKINTKSDVRKVAAEVASPNKNSIKDDWTFLEILDAVDKMNGLIAYIPGIEYKAKTEVKLDPNFNKFDAGQLAAPRAIPVMSSANIILNFRGLGSVEVLPEGAPESEKKVLYPSIYREKSIYKNNRLALSTVGILADKKFEGMILEQFSYLNPVIVKDEKMLEFFSRIVGKTPGQVALVAISLKGVKAYKNVPVINFTELATAVNDYEQVSETYKQCAKIERDYIKKAKGKYGNVHSSLQGLTNEQLEAAALAGIDLKNFTFSRTVKDEGSKAKKDGEEVEKALVVKWSVELTEIAAAKKNDDIADIVAGIQAMADAALADATVGEKLIGTVKAIKSRVDDYKTKIWYANLYALAEGEDKFILGKGADGKTMTDTTSTRMKTSKRASVNIGHPAVDTLTLTLSNATNTQMIL